MKISVIIPVYNAENYLEECLNSVLLQPYKNLEILLINDGSTDSSYEICQRYAETDQRIKLYSQENQGVSVARNLGIEKATGDFIHFVDSDDYISPNMYTDLMEYIHTYQLDIICCKVTRDPLFTKPSSLEFIVRNGFDATTHGLLGNDIGPCDKIVKRSLLEGIKFPIHRKFEDVATTFKFYHRANKVGYLNTPYYYYRLNYNSATQTSFNSKQRYDYILSSIDRYNFAKEHNYDSTIAYCVSQIVEGCLSALTTMYVEHGNPKESPYYPKIRELILKYRNNKAAISLLNTKYKIFLYSFERAPFIHRKMALISAWSKRRKQKRKSVQ